MQGEKCFSKFFTQGAARVLGLMCCLTTLLRRVVKISLFFYYKASILSLFIILIPCLIELILIKSLEIKT
ncbi:Uncharacterized protein TCM_045636 [Theobroma cacao]|uniref:Uncharacterized protein n=1 Tax=Theobroma cacao TaxID=3641 RepID=S1SHZ7_THECC|nr:Uncharacterized protein TCM_045636 [Theobroma cacao]